jgi:hypothetical protein
MLRRAAAVLLACLTASLVAAEVPAPLAALSPVEAFDYVVGTQTFGARYQFTAKPRLLETAEAIRDMGSNILKFQMSKGYGEKWGNIPAADPAIKTLTDLAREPTHKQVLDMPFGHYLIWAYCFTSEGWNKGFAPEDREKEYREMYDFARHLLVAYNGSGKTFLLGHWEGDWHLTPPPGKDDPTPAAIQGMIDWLNVRQKAVDDAQHDTPHKNVRVFQYTEVNLVRKGMKGRPCVTNAVLPKTQVDYVSYSSYDSLGGDTARRLREALDYIESKLPPKPAVAGKRVFIGEYGFPLTQGRTPAEQDELSRTVMRTGLEWGCPYVLYWEMFNNEVLADGTQRGFWLIDNNGKKQPVYFTHQRYSEQARKFVADFEKANRRLPTPDEFRKQAVTFLDSAAK